MNDELGVAVGGLRLGQRGVRRYLGLGRGGFTVLIVVV